MKPLVAGLDSIGRVVIHCVEETGKIMLLFSSILFWMFRPPHKMVEYSQANGIRGGKIHFCRRPDGNLNAQIGKRFRNVVLRGGILDSTGGIGVDYMALNDRLKLTFEAFDFSSNRNAHLKGYADLQLFKYLYLTGGWDDFISNQGNSSGFVGLSIRFEDDDLKYLLTSTPIPK